MKIYTVYVKKDCESQLESALFIKEGFSLWAAVFQGFWTLFHKMWLCSAALVVTIVCFFMMEKYAIINEGVLFALRAGLFVFVGFNANDWYRQYLDKTGYGLFEIVSGSNELDAKQRFFDCYAAENKLIGAIG